MKMSPQRAAVISSIFLIAAVIQEGGAQWIQTNGPYGGIVNAIAVDTASDRIYAGTSESGIFLSTNSGASWKQVNTGLQSSTILSLAIDGNYVFAGTAGGIFRSTDRGTSWKIANSDIEGIVTSLVVNDRGIVLAGTSYDGIIRSTDHGVTWNHDISDLPLSGRIAALIANGDTILAGSVCVYQSCDNGKSWKTLGNGCAGVIYSLVRRDKTVYVGTGSGVYYMPENETTWGKINVGLTDSAVKSLAMNRNGELFAGTFQSGIFRISNLGKSWTSIADGLPGGSIFSLEVKGGIILAGTGSGVFRLPENGISWIAATGITGIPVSSVAIHGSMLLAGTSSGVVLSTDNGISWTAVDSGLGRVIIHSLFVYGNRIFAGAGGIYSFDPGTLTWKKTGTGALNPYVTSFAACGGTIFAGSVNEGVFLSSDSGSSWNKVTTGPSDSMISSLAVNEQTVYAGTLHGVFYSTDYGATWKKITTALTNTDIYALAVCNGSIFAGTDHGIYFSGDDAATWRHSNNGVSDTTFVLSFIVSGTNIFAGTANDVILSTDGGTKWEKVNSGIPNTAVLSFALDGGDIWAGTRTSGIWRRPIAEMLSTGIGQALRTVAQRRVGLTSVHSDASASLMTIDFYLPEQETVGFLLVTLTGNTAAAFGGGRFQAGINRIAGDIKNIAPGWYALHMRAGARNFVKYVPVVR
jgi:ligand-binding sensor domain-containing protein